MYYHDNRLEVNEESVCAPVLFEYRKCWEDFEEDFPVKSRLGAA